jgi:hypothetical protein
MMTIILLKDTRLVCLHLNMKRMVNQNIDVGVDADKEW